MFKKAIVKKIGFVKQINKHYRIDIDIVRFGIDENIENFLRILFYGNW